MNMTPLICSLFLSLFIFSGCDQKSAGPGGGPPPAREIVFPVTTETITSGSITEYLSLVGNVRWSKRLEVKSEVSAKIVENPFLEGNRFSKNDLLVRFEKEEYESELNRLKAQVARAQESLKKLKVGTRPEIMDQLAAEVKQREARLVQTQKELARVQKLIKERIVTEEELTSADSLHKEAVAFLEQSRAKYEEAKNGATAEDIAIAEAEIKIHTRALELADLNIRRCEIRAPFDGVVLQRYAENTAFVGKSEKLLEIASLEDIEVMMELPERFAPKVPLKTQFQFMADAYPTESFSATVAGLIPLADLRSRNLQLRADVEQKAKEGLIPGMFVRAQFPIAFKENAILVPLDAIVFRNNQRILFVIENNEAKMFEVELGLSNATQVEVLGPFSAGQQVVTVGGEVLFPGAKVQQIQPTKS